jgi:apolipoprotein N-acyltransferase
MNDDDAGKGSGDAAAGPATPGAADAEPPQEAPVPKGAFPVPKGAFPPPRGAAPPPPIAASPPAAAAAEAPRREAEPIVAPAMAAIPPAAGAPAATLSGAAVGEPGPATEAAVATAHGDAPSAAAAPAVLASGTPVAGEASGARAVAEEARADAEDAHAEHAKGADTGATGAATHLETQPTVAATAHGAPAAEGVPGRAEPSTKATPWAPVGALRPRIAYPLAVLSGLLYFLAFPGIDLWPLAFVALAPLLVAMRGQPVRRAAGLGWAAGFTMTMTGFYWLMEMLRVFSGFPTPVCFLFMCILCAYQGGRIALCGWLYGRAATRGWPAEAVFLGAFATSELVYPLLFPWYFGATMHLAPALGQVADLGGPILVGLMVATTSVAFAEVVQARREKRKRRRAWVVAGAAVPALAAIYGLVRIASVDAAVASAEKIRLGIVQPNLPIFDRKSALALHQRMTRELAKEKVDLVVWSEAAVPMGFDEAAYQKEVPRKLTGTLGVSTVVGTVLVRDEPSSPRGRRLFNTALIADEKGAIGGRYDKHYLLMFGEYLPFGEMLPVLYKYSPNSGRFSPGETMDALDWRGHRIGALICYEDIIPSFVNELMRHDDPDLLVNLTNDAWFGDTTEPWIHFALAKMRAIEQRRFLVRATNSGVSGIIDPVGRVVESKGTFVTDKVIGEVGFMKGGTVYRAIGDIPWYVVAVAMAAMSIFTIPARWRR